MKKQLKTEMCLKISIHLLLFLLIVLFFIKIYPQVLFDGDDWTYIGSFREHLLTPSTDEWNPIKVFPEYTMPLIGLLSVKLLFPLLNDYVFSLTVGMGLYSAFILYMLSLTIYFYSRKKFNADLKKGLFVEISFLVFSILIFHSFEGKSLSLFYASSPVCMFNYILPGMINAAAVIFMISFEKFELEFEKWPFYLKILYSIWIYFCIFSNLFDSLILAVFCFLTILKKILIDNKPIIKKKKGKIIKDPFIYRFKGIGLYVCLLVIWTFSAYMEANGGRAASIGGIKKVDITNTLRKFIEISNNIGIVFLIIMAVVFIYMVIRIATDIIKMKKFEKIWELYGEYIFNIFLLIAVAIGTLVLCGTANAGYAGTVNATWGIWFFLILSILTGGLCILEKNDKLMKFSPAVLLTLIIMAIIPNASLKMAEYVDNEIAIKCDNYIVSEIIAADQEGKVSFELHLPDMKSGDNWPLPIYMGQRMVNTLYHHGLIKNYMTVTSIPDSSINEKLGIKEN
ncbi:MAG: hypothetical protein K5894_13950 [Lachnospiraceae bacterium]|nr:hypothetical protein [Lachnospiraceae bacterium]